MDMGRVDKSAAPAELVGFVLALCRRCLVDDRFCRRTVSRTGAGAAGITRRELEVLALYADGLSNKQVARRLHVSETTVRYHSKNILRKLSAATRSQAVFNAVRAGMLRSH
ncbi:response regulator transcription factor [Pseudonocardia sp.]|uniref:helix-turn-helix transcriptional regulator n=1 Tax=Pseudonocardia sp. TaxID=60912 RepID=UPI003D12B163